MRHSMKKFPANKARLTAGIMAGFIACVIVAGLFGPYGISIVLGGLSLACVAVTL